MTYRDPKGFLLRHTIIMKIAAIRALIKGKVRDPLLLLFSNAVEGAKAIIEIW